MEKGFMKIDEIISVLIKRWKIIFLITLITTIASIITSFFIISPKYQADTKVFIGKEENSKGQEQSYNNNDVLMYQKLLKTYAEIIQTNDLIERAINTDSLNLKSEDILSGLVVTPRADTQILELSYTNLDNVLSSRVVTSVTNEFIRSSKELIPNGNIKIIESVKVPESPVSPNKKMYIGIGFLLGLLVSLGLSFLLELMDNTFKTSEKVEEALGIPVLGTIPESLARE
jgi:capsular polysaccharide biosynthesis protein